MNIIRIYKFSLVLPLIVPLLIALFPPFITVALYAFVVGGIPYIFLAGLLLWLMRGKSEEQVRKILMWSPVLMLLVFDALGLFIGVFILPKGRVSDNLMGFALTLLFLSQLILFIGYAYVLIVFGYVALLKRQKGHNLNSTMPNEISHK